MAPSTRVGENKSTTGRIRAVNIHRWWLSPTGLCSEASPQNFGPSVRSENYQAPVNGQKCDRLSRRERDTEEYVAPFNPPSRSPAVLPLARVLTKAGCLATVDQTVLMQAAALGLDDVVDALLGPSLRANPDLVDANGQNAADHAATDAIRRRILKKQSR